MKIIIITENWQYKDKRVTKVVNDFCYSLCDKYDLRVFHLIKEYSFLMKLFRKVFYFPLSLYNGMLPIDIYDNSNLKTDYFKFKKMYRSDFCLKKIKSLKNYKIIIHWLDTSLFVLSSFDSELLKKYDITVVVHELQLSKWLSVEKNLKILFNVRVLSRNREISNQLIKFGIKSKILRSFI